MIVTDGTSLAGMGEHVSVTFYISHLTRPRSDVLCDLMSASDMPFPTTASSSHKRPLDGEPVKSSPDGQTHHEAAEEQARSLAGSKRAFAYQQQRQQQQQSFSPASSDSTDFSANGDFVLPQHTAELGSMPLHPGILPPSDLSGNTWQDPSPFHNVSTFNQIALPGGSYPGVLTGTFGPSVAASSGPQLPAVPSTQAYYSSGQQSMAAVAENSMTNMMAQVSMDPTSSMFVQPSDADTLAMWSTAPTSFE